MVFSSSSRPEAIVAPLRRDHQDQEQFLRFFLIPETWAMLPVSQVTEVLTLPVSQVVPIPQMPHWVMGVYNWRGEVLWIIDLGLLLGLKPQISISSTCRAIVLHPTLHHSGKMRSRSQMLGLIVNKVEDIEWCNPDKIQSPPASAITPGFAPFLRGYWLQEDNEMWVVLDGESILAAMPTQ